MEQAGDNALASYREVQGHEPGHVEASARMKRIKAVYLERARKELQAVLTIDPTDEVARSTLVQVIEAQETVPEISTLLAVAEEPSTSLEGASSDGLDTALGTILRSGLPVAAEVKEPSSEERAADQVVGLQVASTGELETMLAPMLQSGESVVATEEQSIDESDANTQLAQFQLPPPTTEGEPAARQLPKRLTYEYGYGSESDIEYRTDPDLNRRNPDDLFIITPELNGYVTYRPNDWLETTLELILEKDFDIKEERVVVLPDGELQFAEARRTSLFIDQAFVSFKNFAGPYEFTLGRRNFEDDRHWLYDTSLDVGLISRRGKFRFEATGGRELGFLPVDGFNSVVQDRINTWILFGEYRGIEHIKLAGYTILRDDRDRQEGKPLMIGLRSLGNPTERFSYWADIAALRGEDELSRDFSAEAIDIGGTYRFPGLPFNPNFTLGLAFGSGNDPNDNRNNEFRQTGLQSNETRYAGVSEFLIYGEALDPELSNLRIINVGLGFRPAPNFSVDFVYHDYRLDEIAEELRDSAVTALMNQDESRPSRDVGSGFDIVLGFRSLFGVRRLGLDVRAGWFFPGDAFLIDEGDDNFRSPNNGFSMVTKFWW